MTIAIPEPAEPRENGSSKSGFTKIEDEARLGALELSYQLMLPFTLKAVIELGVLDLLAQHGSLSAREVAEHLSTKCSRTPEFLDRHLRYLASYNVLTQFVGKATESPAAAPTSGGGEEHPGERRYGLAPVCEHLVEKPGKLTLVPIFLLNLLEEPLASAQLLQTAITQGTEPFALANGRPLYEFAAWKPKFGACFNSAMAGKSTIFFEGILDHYHGFQELQGKALVDVGGGTGYCMSRVVAKWPSIRAINFDLPACVASNPQMPGVEHQSGDMFVSVPSANAIFLQWILHNWTDEFCIKLLKNCHKALPADGKLIVVEAVVPSSYIDSSTSTKVLLGLDLLMLTYTKGGKERTEDEFRSLFHTAGFTKFEVVLQVNFLSIIEGYK